MGLMDFGSFQGGKREFFGPKTIELETDIPLDFIILDTPKGIKYHTKGKGYHNDKLKCIGKDNGCEKCLEGIKPIELWKMLVIHERNHRYLLTKPTLLKKLQKLFKANDLINISMTIKRSGEKSQAEHAIKAGDKVNFTPEELERNQKWIEEFRSGDWTGVKDL